MKLQVVPARNGMRWVQGGVRTFLRQPLALGSLFVLFMALISLFNLVPYIGGILALGLLPAATLGMMAATREASRGRVPTPAVLLSALRAGREHMQSLAVLGAMYAFAFLLVLGLSAMVDDGQFARLYLFGGTITSDLVTNDRFELAVVLTALLYIPISLLFWHAPALVHWHGVAPLKSLFFSLVACMRNFGAFTVYSLGWLLIFFVVATLIAVPAGLLDEPVIFSIMIMPLSLALAAMYFSSVYFTFQDCFTED